MKKLLKFARLAIIAIAWASAAQPGFAQCAAMRQRANPAIESGAAGGPACHSGQHPHDRHQPAASRHREYDTFYLPIDEQQ